MKIYLDPIPREIVSANDEGEILHNWYPSSPVSKRLWACLEILRDINDLLEDGVLLKNSGKRKRRAKIIAGQTHTLAKAVNDLCNSITGDREIREKLGKTNFAQVNKIKEDFSSFVPFEWGSELTTYRNKVSSHFDKTFWPKDAIELLNSVANYKIGYWLHACLHVVLDLTKLEIYSWGCESGHKDYVRFMSSEPFIATFKVNDKDNNLEQIVGLDIANSSPRNTVRDVVAETIEYSQWLFKKRQKRIRGLKEDSKENWNTFSSSNRYNNKI